jgi:hypothetical protein
MALFPSLSTHSSISTNKTKQKTLRCTYNIIVEDGDILADPWSVEYCGGRQRSQMPSGHFGTSTAHLHRAEAE